MKKKLLYCAAALCLIVAAVFVYKAIPKTPKTQSEQYGPPQTPSVLEEEDETIAGSHNVPSDQSHYVSKVDFEKLKEINPDIYAWIYIPGTNIYYPVVQSSTDDSLYIDHDSDGKQNVKGAIFTEHLYNDTTFSDTVTVLYGHNMSSKYEERMFGELQDLYFDEEFLKKNNEIIIYLPDREIHFEIFAALPYSRMHLLHYYHTEKRGGFDLLIKDLYATRKLNTVLLEEKKPAFGDQVIILSTCLAGDNRYRYLVAGVCKNNN